MEIQQIVNSQKSLSELMGSKLPAATSFKVIRIAKVVTSIMEDFEKAKQGLFEKYGEKTIDDDCKDIIKIPDEKMKDFQEEYTALAKQEVDQEIVKIPLKELDGLDISPMTLMTIEWMIEE